MECMNCMGTGCMNCDPLLQSLRLCEATQGTHEWKPCESCDEVVKKHRKEFLRNLTWLRRYNDEHPTTARLIQWFWTHKSNEYGASLVFNMPRTAIVVQPSWDAPDLVKRGQGPDTLPADTLRFDPDLRPEQFDGVPADNR
mgnify:CR=1 FL=1